MNPDVPIAETRFAAIDFESAGAVRGATDVPIQIGIAVMEGLEIHASSLFVSFIAPGRPVTWAAQKVHGITNAELDNAPSLHALWPEIKRLLAGSTVVAHGAGTEKRFLRVFPFHGFAPWIDTLPLAKRSLPELGNYTLQSVSEACGTVATVEKLCPGRCWHDALFDAVASLAIVQKLVLSEDISHLPVSVL